jgi:hypothetical protein
MRSGFRATSAAGQARSRLRNYQSCANTRRLAALFAFGQLSTFAMCGRGEHALMVTDLTRETQ